jgi:hypothetical protein
MVYNGTVSFAHAAETALDEEKALEAENSELKRAVFSYFDPVRMAEFAEGRGMVTDKKPQYVSLVNSSE